jgi:hypothetical protein
MSERDAARRAPSPGAPAADRDGRRFSGPQVHRAPSPAAGCATDGGGSAGGGGDGAHAAMVAAIAAAAGGRSDASRLERVARVGGLLVERFHQGDAGSAQYRGRKPASLAAISRQLRGQRASLSVSWLSRSIATYRVLRPLGGAAAFPHLGPSHVRLVLPLAVEQQIALLRRAERERWSVARLQAEARQRRLALPPGRRRPEPRFIRAIRRIERMSLPDGPAFQDLDQLSSVGHRLRGELLGMLIRHRERVEMLERRVSPKSRDLSGERPAPARRA